MAQSRTGDQSITAAIGNPNMRGRIPHRRAGRRLTTGLALLVACGRPTEPPPPELARLALWASVAGTAVATIVVRVSAVDINPALVFNLEIANGQATGSIAIPAGSDRRLQLEAYDANNVKTHEGERILAIVRPGTANDPVSVTLAAIPGHQPITVTFGKFTVTLSGATTVAIGGTTRLTATVRDAEGQARTVPAAEIKWATANPAIAAVDGTGLVSGVAAGTTTVMATYQGAGGGATITVN